MFYNPVGTLLNNNNGNDLSNLDIVWQNECVEGWWQALYQVSMHVGYNCNVVWNIHIISVVLKQNIHHIPNWLSGCPPSANVTVTQVGLATRPRDTVVLKCTVTGLSPELVEHYWWLIKETNTPIFTYMVRYQCKPLCCKCGKLLVQ